MNVMRRNDVEAIDTAGNQKKPLVSIVILNWNGKKFLEKFLPSVVASTYQNKKIIVADNGSTDDSVLFVQNNFLQVQIIENATNEGFAKGYNTALKQIKSDYYILLNSDVEVTPGWIEPVIELMQNNPKIAACQPKILDYAHKNLFEYAGASGGWIDYLGYPFCRGRVFDVCEADKGQYDTVQECFWASGAAMFVKAAAYHKQGGLDEYFFAHQEEIDFCWRLQLAGYKIFVQPQSVVYHVGGGTLPKGDTKKTVLNFRNNLIMLSKNLPVATAIWKVPFRLWLDAASAYHALLTRGDGGYFLAIIKSHIKYVGWLFFNKKKSIFPKKRDRVKGGWCEKSVVWKYFIKKKTTFLEIMQNK
jgi:GT2 family glycosyltransferase